jgi:hypothetical protein
MAMMLMMMTTVVVMVTIPIDIEGDMELFPRERSMLFNVDDK